MQERYDEVKEELSKLLGSNERYLSANFRGEQVVDKLRVSRLINSYDKELLQALCGVECLKNTFFVKIDDGTLVFRQQDLLRYINMREFMPDCFTAYRTRIGLGFDESRLLTDCRDVVLNFPYKDCVLQGSQSKDSQHRYEVFYNCILAPTKINRLLDPKIFVNWRRYTDSGYSVPSEISFDDNFIIKGNNLVALAALRDCYTNKVKLIYIDPPYNTGSDSFNYNDRYSHSSWLVFMKNRLEIAKWLLRDDGCIFVLYFIIFVSNLLALVTLEYRGIVYECRKY